MTRKNLTRKTGHKRPALFLLLALFATAILASPARAQADKQIDKPDITLEVGGLACPFCAYGIEKRLKKIEGLAEVSVLLEEGTVELKMKDGATVSEDRLKKAVKEAGFEVKQIVFVNEKVRAPQAG